MTSLDKTFYDGGVLDADIVPLADDIKLYVENWADDRREWFKGRDDVRVLDLGAGSCSTSLLLSKEPWIKEIVAVDISTARMKQMVPHARAHLGGDESKFTYGELDMNARFEFPDGHFDLVVMDAALHHSRNIWYTLSEIHRVLKRGGWFVAQREHYVSPLTSRLSFNKLLKTEEVRSGVSENAFLKDQYRYYLQATGFAPRFKAIYPKAVFKGLFFLNGIAFSKYNILARREDQAFHTGLS